MKLKLPKLTIKRPGFLTRKPAKPVKLNAATARMRAGEDDFDDEPQTRLSSAFFVVLILHVVAVGGIYAFNSIKAHRRNLEPALPISASKPAIEKSLATEPAAAPAKPHAAPAQDLAPKAATAPLVAAQLAATPTTNGKFYHVKQGDTLSKISQQTGVSVAALQMANKETTTLKPGQILNVPVKTTSAAATQTIEPPAPNPIAKKTDAPTAAKPASAPGANTYEVQKKDTATSIAKHFNVSVDDLLKLNKISDPTKLQLGAKLAIPAKKN